jgi:antitoxin HicB
MRRYTVLLFPEPVEGGYSALVPSLPGCASQGETFEEALANVREAIQGHLETLEKLGEEVPEEQEPPAVVAVEVATAQAVG